MEATFESNKRTARLAASLFFFVCWPLSWWAESYTANKVYVPHNAAATTDHLIANEFIFRTGIVTELVGVIVFATMGMILYRLFSPVDKHLSRMMMIPPLIQVVIVFIIELLAFTAVATARNSEYSALLIADDIQRQQAVYFLLRVQRNGFLAYEIFWGLWFFLLGLLLYRSDYAPRIIGMITTIGGVAYVVMGLGFILLQYQEYVMVRPYLKYIKMMGIAACMHWFLIKGVKEKKEVAWLNFS